MTPAEIAAKLDAIDGRIDPEADHDTADQLLLAAAPPEVADAYRRLVERADWWASA